MTHHALVVGGGIGGLTAALCLARVGHRVTLLEQANEFGEIGAGIQLSPNAMRVLRWLGLDEALAAVGSRPTSIVTRHWRTGRQITSTTIAPSTSPTHLQVHRADVVAVLADAARRDPAIEIRLGVKVSAVIARTDRASVETADSNSLGADFVVGADGIHSVVRDSLFGPHPARFTGHVAWRGLIESRDEVSPGTDRVSAWWGPRRHFVHYPVRAGRWINCVAVVEQKAWQSESWIERGDGASLVEEFEAWHPSVRDLIDRLDPDTCFKWGLFDRAPLASWGSESATLVGDACHPMLPFLAQGGALAIEDAAVLAGRLQHEPIVPALRAYEERRRVRTRRLQMQSKRNGKIFHLSGVAAWARNAVAQPLAGRVLDAVFGYDAIADGGLRDDA